MKRLAILTSGGDASTMNKCLSSFVTYSSKFNCEIFFVLNGYKGLYDNQIYKAEYTETKSWWNLPGSKIYSSRFMDILKPNVQAQIVNNLKEKNIDYLIVIGGDGSFKGANLLASHGIKVFCLPGTIDNDVVSSSYSIGFDTALNVAVNSINQIKSSMNSHKNIAMIELMGRHCIDLTVFAAIATEADIVLTHESFFTKQQLLDKILSIRKVNKRGIVILFIEKFLGLNNIPSVEEYIDFIHKNSSESVKLNHLGWTQRGGTPTAMDLVRATMMVYKVFELISCDESNKIIGNSEFDIVAYDLEEGLNLIKESRKEMIIKYIN